MTVGRIIAVIVLVVAAGFLAFKYGLVERSADGGLSINEQTLAAAEFSPFTEGDALFAQAKYDAALSRYREGLAQAPEGEDTAAARFRIARCLEKLGRNRDAADAYSDFVRRYPNDNRAQDAKKKIEMLKGL